MPDNNPSFPERKPPETKPNERPGIGIFQMLGLGLFVFFLFMLLIVVMIGLLS